MKIFSEMTKNHLILQIFLSVCAVFSLSSCSSDDDKEKEPELPSVKMGVASMEGGYIDGELSEYQSCEFKNVKYDSQGRPISYEDGDGDTYTYQYANSEITVISNRGTETLTLSNGVIADSEMKYNSSNQIISNYDCKITWENGNPVKQTDEDGTSRFEYYSTSNVLGCLPGLIYSTEYLGVEYPLLQCAGFYGELPKNSLKSIYYDGALDRTFTYSDFNEYGYPCTMKCVDADGDVQTWRFTWVKI